jgi:SAM-dependent methyltransferase
MMFHEKNLLPPRIFDVRIPWAELQPSQFRHSPCALCGSSNYVAKVSFVINWSEFHIVQCTSCGLQWRNPIPDTSFLNELYSEKYFDVQAHSPELLEQVGIPDATGTDHRMRMQKTEEEVLRWIDHGIQPIAEDGTPRKLLEIGGGRGYLQWAAEANGWDTIGLEISPHGIKEGIKRNLFMIPIALDDLCDRYLPYREYFDTIVFFDFLEHVTEPERTLRVIRSMLKNRGSIILRIPCIEDDETPKYHLIDHIFHFSHRTLSALLQKEGFEIAHCHDSGRFPTSNGQIQNKTYYGVKTQTGSRAVAQMVQPILTRPCAVKEAGFVLHGDAAPRMRAERLGHPNAENGAAAGTQGPRTGVQDGAACRMARAPQSGAEPGRDGRRARASRSQSPDETAAAGTRRPRTRRPPA